MQNLRRLAPIVTIIILTWLVFIVIIDNKVKEIENFKPLEKSVGFTMYENVENNLCTDEMPKSLSDIFWHVITKKTRPHHITLNSQFTKNYLTNSKDKIEIVSYLVLDQTMVEGKKKMCKNLNKYLETIKNGLVYEKIQEMIIVENLFIDRLEFLNDSQMLWKKMQLETRKTLSGEIRKSPYPVNLRIMEIKADLDKNFRYKIDFYNEEIDIYKYNIYTPFFHANTGPFKSEWKTIKYNFEEDL